MKGGVRSFNIARESEPLKSKRVETSLFVCSTAFLTSCLSTSETMSNEGMVEALGEIKLGLLREARCRARCVV